METVVCRCKNCGKIFTGQNAALKCTHHKTECSKYKIGGKVEFYLQDKWNVGTVTDITFENSVAIKDLRSKLREIELPTMRKTFKALINILLNNKRRLIILPDEPESFVFKNCLFDFNADCEIPIRPL